MICANARRHSAAHAGYLVGEFVYPACAGMILSLLVFDCRGGRHLFRLASGYPFRASIEKAPADPPTQFLIITDADGSISSMLRNGPWNMPQYTISASARFIFSLAVAHFFREIPVKTTIVGSSTAAFTHDSSFITLSCGIFRSGHHPELRPMVSVCRYRASAGCL